MSSCELWIENALRDGAIRVRSALPRCGQRLIIPSKPICRVVFSLMKTGAPTGNGRARVRRVSDDSIIQTSPTIIDVATLEASHVDVPFDFNVFVNEEVRILFEIEGGISDDENYVRVGQYQTSDVIPGYLTYYWHDAYQEALNTDTTIKMYETVTAPPPPEHLLTVGSSPIVNVPVSVDGVNMGNTPIAISVLEEEHQISVPEEVEA